jgi:DNA invertase Pin-like site-specific DNA recombinase
MNAESKVTGDHLQRAAYLYVRQSTLRQVLENKESTQRQYALRQRAVALGWPEERIIVIDDDQAHSAASMVARDGFQRLVAEVGLGKAGMVMSLEVSRLARNCADWHRLLEICGLTHTLILDEDGLYDAGHFNDRLLLGLKGAMSEAELHILKARLTGGVINKARRGELKMPPPVGLVYDEDQRILLEPDRQVQNALRIFFTTFDRTGSAWATVQAFRREGLKFPRRGLSGTGEIAWHELSLHTALDALHNPRYAGVFCFGRTRSWKDAQGRRHHRKLPQDQWRFLKKDAHPGYISWEQFQANQARLLQNHQSHGGQERKAGPPREGPALLQGLVICGKCGRSMTVNYHQRRSQLIPDYVCEKECAEESRPACQRVPGEGIDDAVGKLLIESVTPMALEVALNIQSEIQARLAEADRLRRQQVQRVQYEADQARLRYMRVDPNNRLVADTLEAQWNEKLRLLAQAKEECEKQGRQDAAHLSTEQKARILALASDFPRLWNDPKTLDRDRKRMARLLLEDATLTRQEDITIQLRFKGGATKELRLPLPLSAWALRKTKPEIIAQIDQLLGENTENQVAQILNQQGWHSSSGSPFTIQIVGRLRRKYRLKSRRQRLREQGWLTVHEVAALLDCSWTQVKYWVRARLLFGLRFGEKNDCLYRPPSTTVLEEIRKRQRRQCWKSATIQQDL